MLWPEVIIPKIATLSKGPEPRPSCIIFCFTSHPCASCYHHFCLHQWVPPLDDVIVESSLTESLCSIFPEVWMSKLSHSTGHISSVCPGAQAGAVCYSCQLLSVSRTCQHTATPLINRSCFGNNIGMWRCLAIISGGI